MHLDPSTQTSLPPSENSTITIQVSAWWYTSLGCSLLSAFGGLLSKQWIIRYRKRVVWAGTFADQCSLRELRFEGLVEWKFYGIMETLPLLLQLSLLLFAIGLAKVLWPQSRTVAGVVIGSIVLGGIFYMFTLLCGILYSQCPYKSPVTDFLRNVGVLILFWIALAPVVAIFMILSFARGHRNVIKRGLEELAGIPVSFSTTLDHMIGNMIPRGNAGIHIWALRRAEASIDLVSVETVLTVHTAPEFRTTELLYEWINNAEHHHTTSSNTSIRLSGDVLFHLLEQSSHSLSKLKGYFAPKRLEAEVRRIWRVQSVNGLVFADMQTSTVSAYLYMAKMTMYGDHLSQESKQLLINELATWLPEITPQSHPLFPEALTLSSWLLVPPNTEYSPDAYNHAYAQAGESILLSLERLAKYQGDYKLLPIVLGTPALIDFSKEIRAELRWKSGKTSQDVITLIRRSQFWSSDALGDSILSWVELLAQEGNSTILSGFQTSDVVPLALATFNSTSTLNYATSSPNTDDLKKLKRRIQFLDVALGLRYFHIIASTSRFRRTIPPTIAQVSPEEHAFAILLKDPHVLKVMIDVLNDHHHTLLPSILSILVKGKTLFLSQGNITRHAELASELEALEGKVVRSGRPWDWLGYEEGDFTQAEAAVSMLKELSRLVKVSVSGLREELRVSGGRGREPHCGVIELYGIGRKDLMV